MSYQSIVKSALNGCKVMQGKLPNFPRLQSIEAQLNYLQGLLDGSITDKSKLNSINIGMYAAREFESRDMSFAETLYQVEDVVSYLKRK